MHTPYLQYWLLVVVLQTIFEVATSYVKQNKPCLEACLRCLVQTLESFVVSTI